MKLKKRQFARLKDIAEAVNHVLPGTGIQLDKLIAEIESVQKVKEEFSLIDIDQLQKDLEKQKVKTIKEKPLSWTGVVNGIHTDFCAKDTKENREMLESLVKKYGGTFSDAIIDLLHLQHLESVEANIRKEHESMFAASTDKSTTFNGGLRDAVEAVANTDPKIGDVGYFWTTGGDTRYGKIKEISSSEFKGDTYTVYRIDQSDGCEFYVHFSKTPPELK